MDSLKIRAGDINPTFNNGLNNQTEDHQERTSLVIQWLGLKCFYCQRPGFYPWSRNYDLTSHEVQPKIKKKKKSQINNLTSQLKNLEKRTDSKASKIKEIIQIKADINERTDNNRVNKTESWFFEKINKTDKLFANQEKKRLEKPLKSRINLSSLLSSLLLILEK